MRYVILFVLLICSTSYGIDPELKPGDILLTRNAGGEEMNGSPGYFNHTAILASDNWVVEAQQYPNSIIGVPVWHFFDRYPEVLVLRPKDEKIAKKTADFALQTLGRKYNKYESIRPLWLWHGGDNCVSAVRRIYYYTTNIDYRWRIPDDLSKSYIFNKVAHKKDYDNYQFPDEVYKGMIKRFPKGPPTE
jgi:hypothetical protein